MRNLLSTVFVLISFSLHSQSLEEKMSREICECVGTLEGEKNANEKVDNCIQTSFENFATEMYQTIRTSSESKKGSFEDYANSIEGYLLNNCVNYLKFSEKDLVRPEEKSISDCDDLKIGSYYYDILKGKERGYLTFTSDRVIETRINNFYSINKIEWIDKCTYKLTLLETNSKYDETNVKNKPLTFKIIKNNENDFVVQTKYYEKGGFTNVLMHKLSFLNKD